MKAAVASLTKSLAVELGGAGIRVNPIAPDAISTPGDMELSGEVQAVAHHGFDTPLDVDGDPEDAAAVAVFLGSSMSRFVTGATIHLDGGTHAAAGWHRTEDGQFKR